jgi:hypothetical protein
MGGAAGLTEKAFNTMMDTPEKRWAKAMNTLQNAGINIGNSLLPVVEKVIEKIGGIADSLARIDFSQYTGVFEKAFGVIEFFAGALSNAVKTVWQFRYIIIAIAAPIMAYNAALMGITIATGIYNKIMVIKKAITAISTGYQIAYSGVLHGSAAAMGALTFATEGTVIATNIWAVVLRATTGIQQIYAWQMRNVSAIMKFLHLDIVRAKIATLGHAAATRIADVMQKTYAFTTTVLSKALKLLKLDFIAAKIHLVALSVAQKAAAAAQWVLNAAMNANPIGLVVTAIAALVGIIAALVKWGKKAAAVFITIATVFTGPVGLAIGFIISAVVELIQNWDQVKKAFKDNGLIGAILRIGGVLLSGILAPVQGLLEILSYIPGLGHLAGKGAEKIEEFRNLLKGIDGATVTAKVNPPENVTLTPDMGKAQEISLPGFNMPEFALGGAEAVGKSKFHGVFDISGGALVSPFGDSSGTYTASGAIGSAAVPDIPDTVTRGMAEITAVLRKIDASVSDIFRRLPVFDTAGIAPEIIRADTVTRTSFALPRVNMSGDSEDAPDYTNPRAIAPITQAERTAYSVEERINRLIIEVTAEKGTAARIARAPRDAEIELVSSGGNA